MTFNTSIKTSSRCQAKCLGLYSRLWSGPFETEGWEKGGIKYGMTKLSLRF